MACETFKIKSDWNMDLKRWEYHVYSSRTGFMITCQTQKQAIRFVEICKGA